MKKILLVSELYFPHGSAMSERMNAFLKLFKDLGFETHTIAMHTDADINLNEYNGFSYEIIKNTQRTTLDSFFGSNEFIDRINNYLKNNKVDYVFAAAVHAKFNKLLKTCKANNVPLILEQCEWYDVSSYKFGYLDYRYIRFNYNIKNNYKKADYIVSISRLLDDYYRGLGCKSIRIPSIFDVEETKFIESTHNQKIELIYAGNPSKSKDSLVPIIEAIALNKDLENKFNFNICGPSKNEIINLLGDKKDLLNSKSIIVKGNLKKDELIKCLNNSDYQIFVRPNRRSSNAGFSTKFGESMSIGLPVITNLTSDIDLYLKDGINGFVCKGNTTNDVVEVLNKVSTIDKTKTLSIRKQARITAEEYFDYRKYEDDIQKFLTF